MVSWRKPPGRPRKSSKTLLYRLLLGAWGSGLRPEPHTPNNNKIFANLIIGNMV